MAELTPELAKQLKALESLPDSDIDVSDPDAVESTASEGWVRAKFYRPIKKPISIRVDAEVLDWFKNQEGKYQSLMNRALREFMETHR